jgi:hypothetical protein
MSRHSASMAGETEFLVTIMSSGFRMPRRDRPTDLG